MGISNLLAYGLVAWGSCLDIVGLFLLPLLGHCEVMNELLKYGNCDPIAKDGLLCIYLMGLNGVVRLLAGLYPHQGAMWYAGATSMWLEVALTIQIQGPPWSNPDSVAACGLCGLVGLLMVLFPPATSANQKID